MLEELLGALKEGVWNALQRRAGIPPAGAPQDQRGGSPPTGARPTHDTFGLATRPMPSGETIDSLLPTRVGEFTRARVNDRFGGLRSGGVFAGYRSGEVEVRVLALLRRDAAAAREWVREAGGGEAGQGGSPIESLGTEPSFVLTPAGAVWSRGPYCFSASANETEGDMPLPATGDQVAAFERFMRAFPY
jgi:hypothetical protein